MSAEGRSGQIRTHPVAMDGAGAGRIIAASAGLMPEGSMRRHDWIFDMLSDLQDYALVNGLPDLACSVEAALAIARRETSGADGDRGTDRHPARCRRTH